MRDPARGARLVPASSPRRRRVGASRRRQFLPRARDRPAAGVPARWLPWGADERVFHERGLRRVHDLVFVGTVDPATRPKRAAVVECLRRRFGLATFGESVGTRLSWEEMAAVFASSKIVLNEAILGDLNFRVFEAMACGALLATERIDNGLLDLFTPGEHLAVYGPDDLVPQVAHYVRADAERARVAANGAQAVRERHTLRARMAALSAAVEAGIVRRDVAADVPLAWGMTAHLAAVRGLASAAVTVPAAAKSLRAAADAGEAEAAVALAEILVWAEQHSAALAVLAEAREQEPKLVRAWLVAAEIERRLGRGEAAARGDLRRALWKSYRYEDAAHQARVARALAAQDGGDASPEERARAAREAEAALGDAALARLEAGDLRGARLRLERARAAGASNAERIDELLALVREAEERAGG